MRTHAGKKDFISENGAQIDKYRGYLHSAKLKQTITREDLKRGKTKLHDAAMSLFLWPKANLFLDLPEFSGRA